MNNILDQLIYQFDTLVPFLALSDEKVFELIKTEKSEWFSEGDRANLLETHKKYKIQISQSTFLLGVSYFEAFLADLVKQIYRTKPKMLPNEKQLKFEEITSCSTYEGIIDIAVNREVFGVFNQSYEKIIEYLKSKLNLPFEEKDEIIRASKIRNCLLHNGGISDDLLASKSRWKSGEFIDLQVSEVHDFGIATRQTAREIFKDAESRYFNS
jgi:uncharacterized protein YutE (UPF0331/DUF86 family)